MAEFRWILVVLFLVLMSHFTAAAEYSYVTVRDGLDVTLSCGNVKETCDNIHWTMNQAQTQTVELVTNGKIKKQSDRLNVTVNCSLVIKKVRTEDAALYSCRQDENQHFVSDLSVVVITEHQEKNQVTLSCSVRNYDVCRHKLTWMFNGNDVETGHSNLKTSQSDCSISVTFDRQHFIWSSENNDLLKCSVTETKTKEVQLFNFRRSSSGETTITTTSTTTTTIENTATVFDALLNWREWLRWIVGIVGLAALIITVVVVNRRTRGRGNETAMDEKFGLSLTPAESQSGPGTRQDTMDPEDGVSYA